MIDLPEGPRRLWVLVCVSLLAGLALGAVTLLGQKTLPYPWANLANSGAVWAVGAFAIGYWARRGRWQPALAGVVLLTVATESYYLTATLALRDDISNLWSASTVGWLGLGLIIGVVFGTAGAWAAGDHRWRRPVGVALLAAVFLAEAVIDLLAAVDPVRDGGYGTPAIALSIAVLVPLVLGRTGRQRLEGLAGMVPAGLLGLACFLLAGYGGVGR